MVFGFGGRRGPPQPTAEDYAALQSMSVEVTAATDLLLRFVLLSFLKLVVVQ